MKPQLTLQTPLELPYQEISSYLNKLWISEDKDNTGANTFTLMVWQPAWLEQCSSKRISKWTNYWKFKSRDN